MHLVAQEEGREQGFEHTFSVLLARLRDSVVIVVIVAKSCLDALEGDGNGLLCHTVGFLLHLCCSFSQDGCV